MESQGGILMQTRRMQSRLDHSTNNSCKLMDFFLTGEYRMMMEGIQSREEKNPEMMEMLAI